MGSQELKPVHGSSQSQQLFFQPQQTPALSNSDVTVTSLLLLSEATVSQYRICLVKTLVPSVTSSLLASNSSIFLSRAPLLASTPSHYRLLQSTCHIIYGHFGVSVVSASRAKPCF